MEGIDEAIDEIRDLDMFTYKTYRDDGLTPFEIAYRVLSHLTSEQCEDLERRYKNDKG